MKRSRKSHARSIHTTSLSVLMIFIAAQGVIFSLNLSVSASPEASIAVDPSIMVANPDQYFTINITITDVTDLFSYEAKLGFEGDVLEALGATERLFLKEGTTSPLGTFFTYKIERQVLGTFIYVACVTLGRYPGVSGNGNLFTVDLMVRDGGISNLRLYDTILLDSNGTQISHGTSGGIFHTTVPRAQFTYETEYPVTGENMTFNASSSYDPDGNVVSYEWDFGDGTADTGVTTAHAYAEEGRYKVVLQVTDNDGLSDDAVAVIYPQAPILAYVPVPYYRQLNNYYCGPAALEMIFDFYGPDVSQSEIADVARTAPDGTYTPDMVRAAHFSNLSISARRNIAGYTARRLGYAAFECWDMTIDQLKSLINTGHPVIVLTTWHYRVAVGYSSSRVIFQDSYWGENYSMTYEAFDSAWDYSSHWALFVSPWKIEVFIPHKVSIGNAFNITARITYPSPPPFPTDKYPASSSSATVELPAGLSLLQSETVQKTVDSGDLFPGASANVTWIAQADSPGVYTIFVEAQGNVAGFAPPIPSYPEPYNYEDRIGGCNHSIIDAISGPEENIREMIETINTWSLPRGIRRSLTSKLSDAIQLLSNENEDGAIRRLMVFIRRIEALQKKRLTSEQADYLISEAHEAIDTIQG